MNRNPGKLYNDAGGSIYNHLLYNGALSSNASAEIGKRSQDFPRNKTFFLRGKVIRPHTTFMRKKTIFYDKSLPNAGKKKLSKSNFCFERAFYSYSSVTFEAYSSGLREIGQCERNDCKSKKSTK